MSKLCPTSKKRMFRSAGAARRSGRERYGDVANAYRCVSCGHWHLTRRGAPDADHDPQIEALAVAALGSKAR